jgi:hypothetical protein
LPVPKARRTELPVLKSPVGDIDDGIATA